MRGPPPQGLTGHRTTPAPRTQTAPEPPDPPRSTCSPRWSWSPASRPGLSPTDSTGRTTQSSSPTRLQAPRRQRRSESGEPSRPQRTHRRSRDPVRLGATCPRLDRADEPSCSPPYSCIDPERTRSCVTSDHWPSRPARRTVAYRPSSRTKRDGLASARRGAFDGVRGEQPSSRCSPGGRLTRPRPCGRRAAWRAAYDRRAPSSRPPAIARDVRSRSRNGCKHFVPKRPSNRSGSPARDGA